MGKCKIAQTSLEKCEFAQNTCLNSKLAQIRKKFSRICSRICPISQKPCLKTCKILPKHCISLLICCQGNVQIVLVLKQSHIQDQYEQSLREKKRSLLKFRSIFPANLEGLHSKSADQQSYFSCNQVYAQEWSSCQFCKQLDQILENDKNLPFAVRKSGCKFAHLNFTNFAP